MTDSEFAAVWRECFPRVYRYCQFRTDSLADAEDITAETFARLLTERRMSPGKTLAWLYHVARNLAIDRARRAGRETPMAQTPAQPAAATPWRDQALWDAVRRLGSDHQLVVYLRLVEDLPFREVGRLLGRSEGASKMLYSRALKQLETMLEGERV